MTAIKEDVIYAFPGSFCYTKLVKSHSSQNTAWRLR